MGKPAGKRPLGRPGHRRGSYYNGFSRNRLGVWAGLIWLRIWANGGSCEHGNESLGLHKIWEIS